MPNSKGRQRRQPASVTGHDVNLPGERLLHLTLQALAYTILTIEALPEWQQEWSNKEDMKIVLHHWSKGNSELYLDDAWRHIKGIPPLLYKNGKVLELVPIT
jgi:hypothetical protein